MTFTAEEARKGVEEAKLREEASKLAKENKEQDLREAQRLKAKEDLPERMEELLKWVKERSDEGRVDATFSVWSHYGGEGEAAYYTELVTLAVKELIDLGFFAKDKWADHGEYRPADDCTIQDVWTYNIYISWKKSRG